jgi:methyl-accepting chemotaxis protein
MKPQGNYKRRTFVVKKALQYRFIAWVVITLLIVVGLMLADVFISLQRLAIERGIQLTLLDVYNFSNPFVLFKFAVYLAGVVMASVVLSHRVAGPVYRFERSAEEVSKGDLTSRVFLREGDQLVDLRDAFNGMVDTLRGKVAGDVSCAHRAKRILEGLLEGDDFPEEAQEKVRRAVAEMDRVGKNFQI